MNTSLGLKQLQVYKYVVIWVLITIWVIYGQACAKRYGIISDRIVVYVELRMQGDNYIVYRFSMENKGCPEYEIYILTNGRVVTLNRMESQSGFRERVYLTKREDIKALFRVLAEELKELPPDSKITGRGISIDAAINGVNYIYMADDKGMPPKIHEILTNYWSQIAHDYGATGVRETRVRSPQSTIE